MNRKSEGRSCVKGKGMENSGCRGEWREESPCIVSTLSAPTMNAISVHCTHVNRHKEKRTDAYN